MRLGLLDLSILLLYLAGVTALGVWLRRGQRDLRDYFLGGRRMPWWTLGLSIVATETSTLTIIATPAVAFAGNLGFLQVVIGYLVARVLICLIFIPAYFRGEFYTAYQLIEKRFGARMKSVAAGTFLITRALAEGVRVAAVALVVTVAFGTGEVWSVVIILLLTLLYTFYGGLKAVIWTDVMQLAIYVGGGIAAFFLLLDRLPGGWAEVTAVAAAHGDKLRVFDFAFDLTRTYTFWSGLLGGTFLTLASHGTDQLMVQRLLAARNRWDSQRALLLSGVVVLFQFALFLVIGVMLFAFHQHAPLIAAGESADRIFPVFIVREMPAGLAGLLVAAVFAAAMSTTSSTLNSLASSTVVDFLGHGRAADPGSSAGLLRVARWTTLAWGVVLLVLGTMNWGPLLEAGLAIASITYGSLLGLFLLGLGLKWATPRGALVGMFAGLAVILYVRFATELPWTWYVLVGTSATFAVGALASLLDNPEKPFGAEAGRDR
jgi:solute:Na+ symporter, SSS family